jgi:hypothetical protein
MRHCTEESNVDENLYVISGEKVRHVIVSQGRIVEMSGLVDRATHLNLDYPDHKVDRCVVAARLEVGSPIKFAEGGPLFALVPRSAFQHFGPVDYTARLLEMSAALQRAAAKGKSAESSP